MKTILSILLHFTFLIVNAQTPDWLWADGIGSVNMDMVSSIAVDDSGNVYSTGYFRDTVDFDPGPGIFNLVSNGNEDIFISKINNSGNIVWAKSIGGTDFDWSFSIKIDQIGNIFITGFFNGTVDFDPDTGIVNQTAAGSSDVFVSKLTNSGNYIWTKIMGGLLSDAGSSIAIDDSGNVYTTGSFNGIADFDPDTSVTYNLIAAGELEIFISKLDNAGNFVWAIKIGGTEDDQSYSIALDVSGNVYTTGYFEKTVDFDPGVDTFNLTAGNLPDAFISKLSSSGHFIWAKAFTGIPDNDGYSVAIDKSGYLYTTGYFLGTIDFDPDTTATYYLTSAGAYDIYISKLDSLGNFVWAKTMGGTDDDQSFFVALDDSANIFTTGIFRSTADLDPDVASSFNVTAAGGFDLFVSKLDSAGNFVWAKSTGGTNRDQGNAAIPDSLGNVYVGGYFYSSSIPFGTTTLTNADPISLNSDMFIARLGDFSTGLESINKISGVSVYPNPAGNSFFVMLPATVKESAITIYDFSGKILYTDNRKEIQMFNINNLNVAPGIYFLRIQTLEFIEIKKVVIEN